MDKSKNRIFIGLIVTNIFIASFLLFVIQPMAAKIIVPQLGGAAATWSYCLLFFQGSLLLGYLYSYLLRRFFAGLIQVYIHLSICLLLFLASTLSSAINKHCWSKSIKFLAISKTSFGWNFWLFNQRLMLSCDISTGLTSESDSPEYLTLVACKNDW